MEQKEFFYQDHSGRGITSTLPEAHIRKYWDLTELNNDLEDETLEYYLEVSEVGDKYRNGQDELTRIK